MSEYINRALAVQELEVLRQEYEMHDDCDELVARRCRNAVSALPAADVAPVNGRWVEYDGADAGLHYCSECKGQAFNYEENGEVIEVLSKWCPHCGALMDGGTKP